MTKIKIKLKTFQKRVLKYFGKFQREVFIHFKVKAFRCAFVPPTWRLWGNALTDRRQRTTSTADNRNKSLCAQSAL